MSLWQAYAPAASQHASSELHWQHKAGGQLGEQWQWQVDPELRLSRPGSTAGVDLWSNADQPSALRLQQAYLGYRNGDWQVRAGKQVFDWSQTDTVSPADLLNARDWSDITRVRKVGVPALSVRYGYQNSAELVWIPRQQVSMLPTGPWLPGNVAAMLAPAQQHADGGQLGLRLSGNWLQSDLALVLYKGYSNAPDLALEQLGGRPVLRAFYQPLQAQVLTLSRQVSQQNILRVEVAHYRQGEGKSFIQGVASVDQEMSSLFKEGDTLYALLQYSDSNRRDTAVNALGWPDFRRVLEQNVQLKLNYDPQSDRRQLVEFSATVDRHQHDAYWQLSYQRRLHDKLSVTVGISHPSGSAGTFWGQYRDNRRAYLEWLVRY